MVFVFTRGKKCFMHYNLYYLPASVKSYIVKNKVKKEFVKKYARKVLWGHTEETPKTKPYLIKAKNGDCVCKGKTKCFMNYNLYYLPASVKSYILKNKTKKEFGKSLVAILSSEKKKKVSFLSNFFFCLFV